MTDPIHFSVDADDVLWHAGAPVPPGSALQELLTRARAHEPPPRITLDLTRAGGYESVGRVIYTVHRVGFESGQLDIITSPPA